MRTKIAAPLFLLAWLAVGGHGPALALSVESLTPSRVASASSTIVIATVRRAVDGVLPSGNHVQDLELDVHESWKGDAAKTLRRTQIVAVVDRKRPSVLREVAGNPLVREGETYLLFLRPQTTPPLLPMTTAGDLGVYRARRHGGTWRFETRSGRAVIAVSPEAVTLEPSETAQPSPGPNVMVRPRASQDRGDVARQWRAIAQGGR